MRVCIVLVKKLEKINRDFDVQIDQENTAQTVSSLTISHIWFRASISKREIKRGWSWQVCESILKTNGIGCDSDSNLQNDKNASTASDDEP